MTRPRTASDPEMDQTKALFLESLRCGIHGGSVEWTEPPDDTAQRALILLFRAHSLQAVAAQALFACPQLSQTRFLRMLKQDARSETIRQAERTAEFLLLLRELERRGLRPAVLKGIVCRSLYPEPEQRPSTDEDLLIEPETFAAYHEALLACGLRLQDPERTVEGQDEITYVDPERKLYVELHLRPFPAEDSAYGDCNRFFEGSMERTVTLTVYGREIRTLCPTDHLLYMLCHAYKHILYGGIGVRQICDICLFARRFHAEIDWSHVRGSSEELRIARLAAAMFRIGERHLDIPCPEAFADLAVDELPLLHDCLTGGLYGVDDADRLHSSRMTLEAVSAAKQGRGSRGRLKSLFPPARSMEGRYPYLRRKPWLLPCAWGQRIAGYVFDKKLSAARSLQIGRERIELLKQYQIIP